MRNSRWKYDLKNNLLRWIWCHWYIHEIMKCGELTLYISRKKIFFLPIQNYYNFSLISAHRIESIIHWESILFCGNISGLWLLFILSVSKHRLTSFSLLEMYDTKFHFIQTIIFFCLPFVQVLLWWSLRSKELACGRKHFVIASAQTGFNAVHVITST